MASKIRDFIAVLSGFRKFTIILLLMVTGIIFRLTDFITGAEFVELLRYTTVAFMAGNGIEHVTKAITEWVKKK